MEFMILGIVDIDHLAEFSTLFGIYFVQGLYQFMPLCVCVCVCECEKGLRMFFMFFVHQNSYHSIDTFLWRRGGVGSTFKYIQMVCKIV